MGRYDSSKTRVAPIFDALLARHPAGQSWLPTLLSLPTQLSQTADPLVCSPQPLVAWAWGEYERPIAPPRSLLRWLVQHVTIAKGAKILGTSGETWARRQALLSRDPAMIAEALLLLDQPHLPERAWYILKGPSRPDVYLETPDLLVVIEGMRTESGPTRNTIRNILPSRQ
jgi:hypothetical protein